VEQNHFNFFNRGDALFERHDTTKKSCIHLCNLNSLKKINVIESVISQTLQDGLAILVIKSDEENLSSAGVSAQRRHS